MYINPKNLALAGGIVHGVWMFLLTLVSSGTGYAHHALSTLQDAYPGFTLTFGGSVLILVYGFLEAFIGFFLIAWLYNKFSGECESCSSCSKDKEHSEHKEWK